MGRFNGKGAAANPVLCFFAACLGVVVAVLSLCHLSLNHTHYTQKEMLIFGGIAATGVGVVAFSILSIARTGGEGKF